MKVSKARNKTARDCYFRLTARTREPRNQRGWGRRREEDNVSSPHPLFPPSCLFINRDFFCYPIADSIGDLSHAASLCNYAGECTTRNKIAEKSIRNAATRTASKIASSRKHRLVKITNVAFISRFCPQRWEKEGRTATRVIGCGTHAIFAIFLFVNETPSIDACIQRVSRSRDIQGSYICVFQKFQVATLPLLNNRIEDEEIIRKTFRMG